MSYLAGVKKEDLRSLCEDLGLTITSKINQQFSRKPFPRINNRGYATKQQEDRPPVKCYGCGTSGFIRAKCPNCTAEPKTESSRFKFFEASSCLVTTASVSTVYLRINGIFGKACADTGSSHSIAGETLYTLLKDEGAKFRNRTMCISLADGHRSTEDVLITTVILKIEGRKFDQELIALPNAKRNRTLLGIDFLKKSGIMLDLRNQQWFFADMPQKQFAFGEHANNQHPVDNLDVNLCTLREEEDLEKCRPEKNVCSALYLGDNSETNPSSRYLASSAAAEKSPSCKSRLFVRDEQLVVNFLLTIGADVSIITVSKDHIKLVFDRFQQYGLRYCCQISDEADQVECLGCITARGSCPLPERLKQSTITKCLTIHELRTFQDDKFFIEGT
ncbi:transposon Ty3-G Gag-Pol polyprotein [Nephila pilipes]|uniref:Transposon Ty3-G Gag-Pol polyprotein n=1 Tax=Nephila pilipes TaxID=299642 RepID=A0A8X6MDB3_NEPPI|nr:transposon Ty3-G Gag-Pol polyprotein [Nephila pilipes]